MAASLQDVRYDKIQKSKEHFDEDENEAPMGRIGVRHIQAIILFFGVCLAFSLRVNLSVGIVAMVDNSTESGSQTVDWTTAQRGTVLGSFFWGYVITQVPGGHISARVGPTKPLAITMIINGISTLLLPVVAVYGGFLPTCFIRFIQGLGQGFFYPSCSTLLSKWAVPSERGRLYAFIFGGSQLGTIVTLSGGGLLAGSAGWPCIFYVSGGVAILWGIVCFRFLADSPEKHRTISKRERIYIEKSLISTADSSVKLKTPWLEMANSVPVWALMACHMAQNWGFWTLLTLMPSYIRGVYHIDIKKNGFLSALPYLIKWVTSLLCSIIADYLIKKKIFTTGVSRKFWNSVALYGAALGLTLLAFLNTDSTGAIALLSVAVGVNSCVYMGYYLNHLDLTPNFSGTLMGITNCAANICSIFGPTLAGFIVTEHDNAAQWKIVFIISAVIYVVGETIFNIYGSAEVQSWNAGGDLCDLENSKELPERTRTS